ncbi:hypothetical protein [Streptomyces sp. NPDC087787]
MKRRRTAPWAASAALTTLALTGTLATPAIAAPDTTSASATAAQDRPQSTADDPVTHEDNDRVPQGAL